MRITAVRPTRMLVADDDPILLCFAGVHLATPTDMIETAPDGATAWSMLTSDRFDIAILDIAMPSPDGFALLERIRRDPKLRHLPVMILTGRDDTAAIDRAYDLGANSFITKPVDWRLLRHHIRYVLRYEPRGSRARRIASAYRDRDEREGARSRLARWLAAMFPARATRESL